MKYYISDLHLGHNNIIHLCNRPFKNVEDMDKTLISNWNKVVTNNDDVYILGDLIFKSSQNTETYLKQLKGNKILVKGNHDTFLKKGNHKISKYFDSIHEMLTIVDNNKRIVLCHYPLCEWDGFFRKSIHLYGHIHNNTSNSTYNIMKKIDNAYNVGADILNFTPCTLNEVINLNKKFNKEN